MINKVVIMGRICQDLELKQTQSGTDVLTFNVAVERSYVRQGEERQSDFITCVAWDKTATFIDSYFAKGRMIAIEGQLRSRTYDDKNGTKHYVTEVYVDSASFTGEPKPDSSQKPPESGTWTTNTDYYKPLNDFLGDDIIDFLDEDDCPF